MYACSHASIIVSWDYLRRGNSDHPVRGYTISLKVHPVEGNGCIHRWRESALSGQTDGQHTVVS